MYSRTASEIAQAMLDGLDREKKRIDLSGLDIDEVIGLLQANIDKKKSMILEYPDNLYHAIFGYTVGEPGMETVDQMSGLEYVISHLDMREQEVITLKYINGKTLDDIGAILNISGGRVRQIEQRALRRMKSPGNRKYIQNGLVGEKHRQLQVQMAKLEQMHYEALAQVEEEKREIEMLKKGSGDLPFMKESVFPISVEDIGLSAHAVHCLQRAGLYTIGDMCKVSLEDMMRIRHTGEKTLQEISDAVQAKTGINMIEIWTGNGKKK